MAYSVSQSLWTYFFNTPVAVEGSRQRIWLLEHVQRKVIQSERHDHRISKSEVPLNKIHHKVHRQQMDTWSSGIQQIENDYLEELHYEGKMKLSK